MLSVKLTENYLGFRVEGDYLDLDTLYDSINHIIHKEPRSIQEEMMSNHLYGFLYEVRHAYQGYRDLVLVQNNISDHTCQRLDVKVPLSDTNIGYCFNYPLVDLVLDMLLIKHFIIYNLDKKENNEYSKELNLVRYFYSLVLDSLKEILTPNRWDRIRRDIQEEMIIEKVFIPQWFEMISLDYIRMSKSKRQREIMHVLDGIIHYLDCDDYTLMRLDLEKRSKEDNCSIDDFHYDFPEKVEW